MSNSQRVYSINNCKTTLTSKEKHVRISNKSLMFKCRETNFCKANHYIHIITNIPIMIHNKNLEDKNLQTTMT